MVVGYFQKVLDDSSYSSWNKRFGSLHRWDKVFRKHEPTTASIQRVDWDQHAEFGSRVSCHLKGLHGDMIHRVWLSITIPNILYTVIEDAIKKQGDEFSLRRRGTFYGPMFCWTHGIGAVSFSSMQVSCDGVPIETLLSETNHMLMEQSHKGDSISYQKILEHCGYSKDFFDDATNHPFHMIHQSKDNVTCMIPIYFWFSKSMSHSIPLFMMKNSQWTITCQFREVDQLGYTLSAQYFTQQYYNSKKECENALLRDSNLSIQPLLSRSALFCAPVDVSGTSSTTYCINVFELYGITYGVRQIKENFPGHQSQISIQGTFVYGNDNVNDVVFEHPKSHGWYTHEQQHSKFVYVDSIGYIWHYDSQQYKLVLPELRKEHSAGYDGSILCTDIAMLFTTRRKASGGYMNKIRTVDDIDCKNRIVYVSGLHITEPTASITRSAEGCIVQQEKSIQFRSKTFVPAFIVKYITPADVTMIDSCLYVETYVISSYSKREYMTSQSHQRISLTHVERINNLRSQEKITIPLSLTQHVSHIHIAARHVESRMSHQYHVYSKLPTNRHNPLPQLYSWQDMYKYHSSLHSGRITYLRGNHQPAAPYLPPLDPIESIDLRFFSRTRANVTRKQVSLLDAHHAHSIALPYHTLSFITSQTEDCDDEFSYLYTGGTHFGYVPRAQVTCQFSFVPGIEDLKDLWYDLFITTSYNISYSISQGRVLFDQVPSSSTMPTNYHTSGSC